MRIDMDKVIVERPRRGRSWTQTGRGKHKLDLDLPQIGLKKALKIQGPTKYLNENLAPLRRYLEAQVNRPWDKVWSEISANLKPSSTVQQHVRDHIPDFVAIKTRLRDGEVWAVSRFGGFAPLSETHRTVYVDPRTGLLRRNPHFRTFAKLRKLKQAMEAAERATRLREAAADLQYHLLDDGAWWEVRIADRPPPHMPQPPDAVLSARLSTRPPENLYGRSGVYAVDKRQLSARAAKQLHLRQ